MLPNVQQTTIKPVIAASAAPRTLIHTDEYDIYARLPARGYDHKTAAWSDEASHHPGTRKKRRWSRPAHRPFRERIPLQRLHLAAVDAKALHLFIQCTLCNAEAYCGSGSQCD